MSDLEQAFEQARQDVATLSERPDNDTLLELYALYKQGAEGDAHGPKPGLFDYVGNAKHEAWCRLRGMTREQARTQYIALVGKLIDQIGTCHSGLRCAAR